VGYDRCSAARGATPLGAAAKAAGAMPMTTSPRRNLIAAAAVLLAVELFALAFLVAGSFGLVRQYAPATVSFTGFYAAGALALVGAPALAYDDAARYAEEEIAVHRDRIAPVLFLYPPVYLFVCAALALLPYLLAFAAFEASTLGLYLFVMRDVLREEGWSWLLGVLAFPGVLWTLGFGQNAFLSAALMGAGTLLVDTRPLAAGIAFGLLCYKPEFGLLVPVALIAGRRWTTLAAASATVALLVGASVLAFGWETWRAFFDAFVATGSHYLGSERVVHTGSITFFGAALLLGLPTTLAYGIQGVAMLAGAALVAWVWRRNASLPTRAAALVAGTLIAVPYALLYDIMLATVAIAWLVRAGRSGGFLPGEPLVLLALYLMPLVETVAALRLHLPLATLTTAALAAICALRSRRERRAG
jgi:hypothetical protein